MMKVFGVFGPWGSNSRLREECTDYVASDEFDDDMDAGTEVSPFFLRDDFL